VIFNPPFKGVTVGAVLSNLGTVMKSYSSGYEETLPVVLSVGGKKQLEHAPLTLYADALFPNDNDIMYAFGLEVNLQDTLFLYAGTKSRNDIDTEIMKAETDFGASPSFGVGIVIKNYRFNYAYSTHEQLEEVHKVTLSF